MNVGASVQSETISPTGTTSNPVLTVDNPDDAAQLNTVISAAKADKLVTKDNIGGQLTDYAKASDLSAKADANDVYSKTAAEDKFATKTELGSYAKSADVYSQTDADGKFATNDALNDLKDTVNGKADKSYVDTEVGKKANKATTLGGYGITDAYTKGEVYNKDEVYNKGEVARKLDKKADQTALDQATGKINNQQTAIDKLNDKTTEISYAAGEGTKISGVTIKDGNIVGNGNSAITGLTNVQTNNINGKSLAGTTVATEKEVADAVKAETDARTAADNVLSDRITANANTIASVNQELVNTNNHFNTELGKTNAALHAEEQIRANADAALANDIKATNDRTGGIERNTEKTQTTIEGSVKVDNKGNVKDVKGLSAETITTTGNADLKGNVILGTNTSNTVTVNGKSDFNEAVNMDNGLTVTNGDTTLQNTDVKGALNVSGESNLKNTTVDGTLSVDKETTLNGKLTAKDEATFTKKVTMEDDLEVKGELKTDKIAMENKKTDADGTIHNSTTTITADGITHNGEVKKNGVTTESQFTHTEKGSETYAKRGDATDWTETRSDLTADGVTTEVKDSKGNRTNTSQTANEIKGFVIDQDGNSSTASQTAKGINGNVTDKDGNKTDMNVTATENSIQIQDKDGKNTNLQVNKMDSSVTEIKNGDGKTTKTEQTAENITNTAQNGTITNDAKNIVNIASENITTTAKTMDTTVTGKATESYGELDTTVNGMEKHTVNGNQDIHVTGKQTNTVESGQENIISGGQTNTITGGQINNITGDQTTTITGNKKETVTENVTEDYKKDLTTTVGGNETHEVKGTKTETVEGKLTENFKGGQETNVTGDQTTNVSGTQTTTATDIKRNASSGMIDTIDNDYGTNTETKVAGKTTTDVSIKGTEEKGQYIRGANESRDYLIKGTLKNSETKTAEATSSEITDGTNKASTRQDAKNLAGSVTNGTETGISGIHANDDGSVSIDSAVAGGGMSSVINQKKDSIQSAVGDGTNSTVIHQDKDNVTIASSNGTVGIVGKDIVNIAKDTITNTAGTSITNQVNDSKVTTDANGTTFENNTPAVSDSGATTTKINGNQITTGRVNANELDVSDTDGNNKADLLVKAGEGVKASASDGNTTGSLDVKADGITTSITNGTDHNTVSSTLAGGTIFTNSEAAAPVTGDSGAGTAVNTTIKGNTITTGKVTMDYADVMKDLGVRGNANITGTTTTKTLKVTENATVGGTLDVTQKATFHDDVDIKKNLSVDGNATIKGDVTASSYKVGDKTYISAAGINANDQKITNVADGSISEGSKDAVNGGQLYGVKRDLEHQVDKVGANAAAMANLRPMEFDPSSKWNIAAAIGNYGSETAAALGAFYRPNDDVMVNLSTAFGTGENMVGGGVSVRLGKSGNKLSREENNALKAQVDDLTARMDALLSVLNPNMSKDFPDVPENHWAYEAVSRLAGNDIVQGYPDGEFHGERTMTRYEMAEIIYNALSRGAEAEKELVEEFKPELQAMAASEKATAEKAEG